MNSKITAVCIGLAVIMVSALPAGASASPVLTEGGVKVAIGSSITGLNEPGNNLVFTGPFNMPCTYVHLAATVTENSGNAIKMTVPAGGVSIKGTGAGEDCTSALGSIKWMVTSELCLATTKVADQLEMNGCEGRPVRWSWTITGSVTCKYETVKILSTFTTNMTPATLLVSEQEAKGEATNSFICPSSGKIDIPLNLFTTDGTGVATS